MSKKIAEQNKTVQRHSECGKWVQPFSRATTRRRRQRIAASSQMICDQEILEQACRHTSNNERARVRMWQLHMQALQIIGQLRTDLAHNKRAVAIGATDMPFVPPNDICRLPFGAFNVTVLAHNCSCKWYAVQFWRVGGGGKGCGTL